MSEQELANVEPTAVMLIAGAVFIITVVAAIILQILAFRHKELVYTEEGMRYINWQKRLAMICTVIIAALLLLDRFVI